VVTSAASPLPAGSELCRLPATALAALLARGEVSSREVVAAHLDRIAALDGRVRAFARVDAPRALAAADEADAERRAGRVRGPLHGLPVSVKECFDVAGEPTTLGLPGRAAHRAAGDAALVSLLREAGAVVLGRTNLSQTMLFFESRNPLFGETRNPFALDRSPGGSSGGEAAALAAGLSPLGIGTDIGGSIRIPAHCCGVTGLKPTLDRLPMAGVGTAMPGQEVVRAQAGPLARTVADLDLLLRALDMRRASALDGRTPPLGWEPAPPVAGLRVGWYAHDGLVRPSPAVGRAVERAGGALRAAGADVVPFTPPAIPGAVFLQLEALSADAGSTLRAALAGGPVDPVLRPLLALGRLPAPVRRLLGTLAAARGDELTARTLRGLGRKPVDALWALTARVRAYRGELLAAMTAARLDLLLCPPFATPAFPHLGARHFTLAASYTMLFNLTQLPAGVVPVTRVRAGETTRTPAPGMAERLAARVDADSAGLPVGVQVVGRPWAEATVLAAMAAIERDVREDPEFPRTPVEPPPTR
jgi:fatty acid amide hydrolase